MDGSLPETYQQMYVNKDDGSNNCTAPENSKVRVEKDFLEHRQTLQNGQYMALRLHNTQKVKTRTISVVGSLYSDIVAVQLRFPPTTSEISPEEPGFAVCTTRFGGVVVLGLYFMRTAWIVGSHVDEDNKHYSLFLESVRKDLVVRDHIVTMVHSIGCRAVEVEY